MDWIGEIERLAEMIGTISCSSDDLDAAVVVDPASPPVVDDLHPTCDDSSYPSSVGVKGEGEDEGESEDLGESIPLTHSPVDHRWHQLR